ncbi:transcription elongation factor GreAB [Saccharobesus litoralis]|uniref:Transcription elongation factor GreAB n=1 Tax=Saccharobesus litoralis TaxID=2172099 RepID=A0A2S0VST6_9ALTE|nr:transcription elongation factor GreAB [Saccharobesus litoralis]AWB67278.1 transcription elongation factor GreAB [Saccharobesus litoralis]
MNKQAIIKQLNLLLNQELEAAQLAADNAHKAAIDDESVAETQYDTLAIEAAYLAEGQSRRVDELKANLQSLQTLSISDFDDDTAIGLSALFKLEGQESWYYLLPVGGGNKLSYQQQSILVVTPHSPIGQAVMGQYVYDEVSILVAGKSQTLEIAQVC